VPAALRFPFWEMVVNALTFRLHSLHLDNCIESLLFQVPLKEQAISPRLSVQDGHLSNLLHARTSGAAPLAHAPLQVFAQSSY